MFNPIGMVEISINKTILEDLVNSKLKILNDEIASMLDRWEHDDIPAFLEAARNGTIDDAEDDAICLRNLVDKRELLFQMKARWNM